MSKKKINRAVYNLFCSSNKKYYVGIDSYFPERKYHHLSLLRRNKHPNLHLQRAFNKYGEASFTFNFLESCGDIDELKEREKFYICKLDSFKNGFNQSLGGESCFGVVWSAETLKKRSLALKGKSTGRKGIKRSAEDCRKISAGKLGKRTQQSRYKIVVQRNTRGEVINEYPGVTDAAIANSLSRSGIAATCRGLYKTWGNYIWKYKNEN